MQGRADVLPYRQVSLIHRTFWLFGTVGIDTVADSGDRVNDHLDSATILFTWEIKET
jgi:hypothetical protein